MCSLSIGFLLYLIYIIFMKKFKVFLNCEIEFFEINYELMENTSKFHLTSFFQRMMKYISIIIIIAITTILFYTIE
jgi:hypothetical protein